MRSGRTAQPLRRRPYRVRRYFEPAAPAPPGTLVRTFVGQNTCAQDTSATGLNTTVDCGTVSTGDLILALVAGTSRVNGTVYAVTKSAGTATIGTQTAYEANADGNANEAAAIVSFQVTAGGTLTLQATAAGLTYGFDLIVVKYTGHDTTTPTVTGVSQLELDADNTSPVGAWSPTTATLANTPISADEVIILVGSDTDPGAGKGWTSSDTAVASTTDTSHFCMTDVRARTGSTSTTITWPTEDGSPATFSYAGVAVIVKVGVAGGAAFSPPRRVKHRIVPISAKKRVS
jgi:hypothetical protein